MEPISANENVERFGLTFGGEFTDLDLEASYRSSQVNTEIGLARVGILALGISFVVFVPSDRVFLGDSGLFWGVLLLRGLLLLSSAALWVVLTPDLPRRRFDGILFAWSLLVIGFCAYIPWTRPIDYTGHIIPNVLTVFYCFTICPLPFRMQCILAMLLTAAGLGMCFRTVFEHSASIQATLVGFLGAFILGAKTSLQLNRRKRELFAAAHHQESLRVGLEAALAQIRTLRGLHCVCCQCKKMRDEKGSWHPFEVYVRDRTHAEFSHGLCPECYDVAMQAMS